MTEDCDKTTVIETLTAFESCVGKAHPLQDLKVIDHLDDGATRWIAAAPLAFVAFGHETGVDLTLAGGRPGFVTVLNASRVILRASSLDEPESARPGRGVGALFLIPSLGETLRVNGRVVSLTQGDIEIAVEECYVHCAKALVRSQFWEAVPPSSKVPDESQSFLAASRFLALATCDHTGRADVSPKGDPSQALIGWRDESAWLADRPGNRRADSFRNILVQPRIAAVALIPGSTQIVMLSGQARITEDVTMRADLAVAEKQPRLVTCIDRPVLSIRDSVALVHASLWPATSPVEDIDPAAVLVAHIKSSKTRSVQATVARRLLSVSRMKKGLTRDYRTNLY